METFRMHLKYERTINYVNDHRAILSHLFKALTSEEFKLNNHCILSIYFFNLLNVSGKKN